MEHYPYAKHFEKRAEHGLFGNLVQDVIDASTVDERQVQDLKVFAIKDVFADKNACFLGFGKPNVYLVVPSEEQTSESSKGSKKAWQKYAAKSLWREPATIPDVSLVQSGVLLYFEDLPEEAIVALRKAMKSLNGAKGITCVNLNMQVMERAGFTSGDKPLSSMRLPYDLFHALTTNGLKFQGRPVKIQVIRVTPTPLHQYLREVIEAELSTFRRHGQRKLDMLAASNKFTGSIKELIDGQKKQLKKAKCASKRKGRAVIAPPLSKDVLYLNDIEVFVSKTSLTGGLFRQLWGAHTLFVAKQTRVKPSDYLPEVLTAFPQAKPNFATKVKKSLLFSPPVIWSLRKGLAPKYESIGLRSEVDIYDMMRTHSDDTSNVYNLVVTDEEIIIARISVGGKVVSWVFSKHVLLSGYSDKVRFAGEIYKGADGVFYISRNSGTYRPTEEELDGVIGYMSAVYPHLTFRKVP